MTTSLKIDIVTIFPEMFDGVFDVGMLRLARERELLDVTLHNLRDFTEDRHKQVDDEPYGGGPGMVMKPEPFYGALEAILGGSPMVLSGGTRTILLSPQGTPLRQRLVGQLAGAKRLVILCGRYEGIDDRVAAAVSDEISIGDYVLSGGEAAAMVLVDAVGRLQAGVLGEAESLAEESFTLGMLEYPHYTRPVTWAGVPVPDVLLSGHHEEVRRWRAEQARLRTRLRRPDLLR